MTRMAFLVVLAAGLLSGAPCWGFESSWTDAFEETTYLISGPDEAAVGDTVRVLISATDPFYPDVMVAAPWRFKVDGLQVDGGFGLFLTGTSWAKEYAFVYEAAGSHTCFFTAQDLGHGNGGHDYQWFEVSGTTEVRETASVGEASRPASWGQVRARFGD